MKNIIGVMIFLIGLGQPKAEAVKNVFGEEWTLRSDIPVSYETTKGVKIWTNLYQNEKKMRLAFRIEGNTKNADVVLIFDPQYIYIKGTPILTDTMNEQRDDVSYKYEKEKIKFNIEATNKLRYIEMDIISRKLGNQGELPIEDKLKQARSIRRIFPQTASWSELAKGQIIAQTTVKPIICHGGYDVNSTKRAIIWANDKKISGTFEILDANFNRQYPAKQPVIYTGKIKPAGFHIWGGNNYIADFSDFKKEGLYFIRLKLNETNEVMDSYVFPIEKGLYFGLAEQAAGWFYYQRCGTEVPGFHKLCHMGDAIVRLNGDTVEITGGWHDAGDYGKWLSPGASGILALTTLEEFEQDLASPTTPQAKHKNLIEALWEAEYFCKGYWDSAFHEGFTPDFDDVCSWVGAPEAEPARILLESDMIKNSYGIHNWPGMNFKGAVLARTARLVMANSKELPDKYKNVADKCIVIAKKAYEVDKNRDIKDKLNSYLTLQTGLLLSALELYDVTKDEQYKKDAEIEAENIIKLQDKDGRFFSDEARTSKTNETCSYHQFALYEFLKRNPGSKLNNRIKNVFKLWADYNMQFTGLSNFGLIGGKEGDVVRNLKHHSNFHIGEFVWGFATAALLTKDAKYLKAAENSLQWIVGFNPADISMMVGVGKNPDCYHHRYCFMRGCESGKVPGGILNGIAAGNGKMTDLGDTDTRNFVAGEFPVDYPIMDDGVWGWTYSWLTSEYWIPNSAWFIMGAIQVDKAMRELKR